MLFLHHIATAKSHRNITADFNLKESDNIDLTMLSCNCTHSTIILHLLLLQDFVIDYFLHNHLRLLINNNSAIAMQLPVRSCSCFIHL